MPRKIILKEEGLNGVDAPVGFKFLGLNNNDLGLKTGATISFFGGGTGSNDNIYTINGTVSSNRDVNLPNNTTLQFNMTNDRSKFVLDVDNGNSDFLMDIGGIEVGIGSQSQFSVRTDDNQGIKYTTDYGSTFVNRSLVDKEYSDRLDNKVDEYFVRTDEASWTFNSDGYSALLWQANFSNDQTLSIDNFSRFRRLKIFIINQNNTNRNITIQTREGTSGSYASASIITDGGDILSTLTVKGDLALSINLYAFYEPGGPTYGPTGDVIGKQ